MKKISMGLIIFLVAFSTHAFAFATGDVILSLYDASTSQEVGYDLGSYATLSAAGYNSTWAAAINLGTFSETSYANLTGGIFGATSYAGIGAGTTQFFGSTDATAPTVTNGGLTNFVTSSQKVSNNYGSNNPSSVSATGRYSFYSIMDLQGATTGAYSTLLQDLSGTMSLTGFDVNGNPLPAGVLAVMNLFAYNGTSSSVANGGNPVDLITIMSNGSIQVQSETTPTPIPAAFLLFGSGLIGLFGMKRKLEVA